MGWEWTCTVEMRGALVVKRQKRGGRDEAKMKEDGGNIRKMRRVVGLLEEGK